MRTLCGVAAFAVASMAAAPTRAQHGGTTTPVPMPAPAPGAPPEPMQMPMAQPGQGTDAQQLPGPGGEPAPEHQGMAGMNHPPETRPATTGMDHGGMAGMTAGPGMDHPMRGALGPYPMTREASGTSWQPDTSRHVGLQATAANWMLMAHGMLNGVYDRQERPRGGEKLFASGMLMGMAQRGFANGNVLQFKAMVSPDPLMGKRGYPLHLASGETANGTDPLIDRQHPHDLFMELSASYSVGLSEKASLFVYGGLPGEPAFGPPAFMHRQSIMDSPEAPITHHWLDSTHIVFGVVTAGLVLDRFKIEASRFHGGEPDQNRYDIETGPLDSTAIRLSFNPTPELSLQASWAHLENPERLEPGSNQTRWSASAIYTRRLGRDDWWSATLAWGRRRMDGENFDAAALEGAVGLEGWTVFGRAEYAENNELLFVGGHHGPTFDVGKISVGAMRDFRLAERVKFGVGALIAVNFVPGPLEALYAGDPGGAMAFVRIKIE